MDWVRENWFFLTVLGLFMWMHTGMHGQHGHGGPSKHGESDSNSVDVPDDHSHGADNAER